MADGDRDVRFCPYCCQQDFDVSGKSEEGSVFCEICGIDIPVAELIR